MSFPRGFALFFGTLIISAIEGIRFVKARRKKEGFFNIREGGIIILSIYILMVVSVTLFPLEFRESGSPTMNVVPVFNTLRDMQEVPRGMEGFMMRFWMVNIFGNIILLLPLGIFLPLLFKKFRSFKATVFGCCMASISIELIQYVSMYFGNFRASDIDDIILNTLGGLIGFLMFKLLNKKMKLVIE